VQRRAAEDRTAKQLTTVRAQLNKALAHATELEREAAAARQVAAAAELAAQESVGSAVHDAERQRATVEAAAAAAVAAARSHAEELQCAVRSARLEAERAIEGETRVRREVARLEEALKAAQAEADRERAVAGEAARALSDEAAQVFPRYSGSAPRWFALGHACALDEQVDLLWICFADPVHPVGCCHQLRERVN
jgi:hypothetical protein